VHSIDQDKDFLIVARRSSCIVIMNKFPYNSGHVLVCPLRHISDFNSFTSEELFSIHSTTQELTSAMQHLFSPHGFNIGINIGQSAGAGVPDHLHYHIVPR